jgi:pimeloyl-ACP methyl ester carboxylesterase
MTSTTRLPYQTFGHGPQVLLAFHGFGQEAAVFQTFAPCFPKYTLYCFDLPFHGQSQGGEIWVNGPADFVESLQKQLGTLLTKPFAVMGFSIGARPALALCMALPNLVERLILVAPDGLTNHPVFTMTTKTRLGRWLGGHMANQPERWQAFLARSSKWVNMQSSTRPYFKNPLMLRKVWKTWLCFSHYHFPLAHLVQVINRHAIQVTLVVATHDALIRPGSWQAFAKKVVHLQKVSFPCRHEQVLVQYRKSLGENA